MVNAEESTRWRRRKARRFGAGRSSVSFDGLTAGFGGQDIKGARSLGAVPRVVGEGAVGGGAAGEAAAQALDGGRSPRYFDGGGGGDLTGAFEAHGNTVRRCAHSGDVRVDGSISIFL